MATRRERVILELQDDFTTAMARATAQVAILDKELKSLSGSAVKGRSATRDIEQETQKLGNTAGGSAREVDRLSGRLNILRDTVITLGPTLAPISTVGVAGFASLASEVGFAGVAAGTAILAFHGIADTLKAVNKAALQPTEANLHAARLAMAQMSPAARDLIRELRGLIPEFERLQGIAQANLFPGLSKGIEGLKAATPELERIVGLVSSELGKIAEASGKSLGSDRWQPFLEFIGTEAPAALSDMSKAIGSVTHGLAELWMAFAPLNRDVSHWLVDAAKDFDNWAAGLDQTQGFQEFMRYVQTTGPELAHTIGAIANAFLKIGEAAAPLAGPTLSALTAVANIVAKIADSDLGTPIYAAVAAMVVYNRTIQATTKLQGAWATGLGATVGKLGLVAAGIAAFQTLDSALNLSLSSSAATRLNNLVDAKGGPDIAGQIQATKDAIKQYQDVANSAAVHLDLGFTDIYSSDKAANAADKVLSLKDHLKDLENQQQVNQAVNEQYATSVDRMLSALTAEQEAARQTGQSFLEFGSNLDDTKVSLDGWIKSLEDQAKALRDFANNAKQAADKGLRRGIIDALEKAGPAGALRLQQLASASEAEIRRANRAWAAGKKAIQDYIAVKVPLKTVDVNTDPAQAKLNALILKINNLSAKANGGIHLTGPTPVRDRDNNPLTPYAMGGYTGQGSRMDPAGIVHRGEVVWSQDDVNAWGGPGVVDAMRRVRTGYASGGTPGLHSYVANTLDMAWPHGLKEWNRALAESTKVLEREKSQRQDLISQRDQLKDTLTNAFRSDLFGQPSTPSVWMSAADRNKAGIGDVFSTLTGDIGNATAYQAALKKLKARGLHGPALGALAASGNLADVQAFAGASAADIKRFQTLYGQRQSVTAGLGGFANDVYGSALAGMTKQLRSIAHENSLLRHEVAKLEKHLKRSTPKRRP